MTSKMYTGAVIGVDGMLVEAEVDISPGMPQFDIVGLPDSSIKEAKERVRSAIKNSGVVFPNGKITVNLAPAYIRKEGSSFDLPIACGILTCSYILPEAASEVFIAGELALDGRLRPVNGILPMTLCARDRGLKQILVPAENAEEAALVKEIDVIPVNSLTDICGHFRQDKIPPYKPAEKPAGAYVSQGIDFSDVKGQEHIKRALEIAAAGKHNILMIGPPGSGKTMMAKRLVTVLPDLTSEESFEVTKVYSVAGQLKDRRSLVTERPFRAPHHTISYAALVGGGKYPMPGEISLADKGVLFMDELPEFQKSVLEVLRQPLEDKSINIARASANITYPADFMLVVSLNPCPCGYYGDNDKCKCPPKEIKKYLGRISGPLLDRIDIQVEARRVNYEELEGGSTGEKSETIKKRIKKALEIQRHRYKNDKITYNSELTVPLTEKYCRLDAQSNALLGKAFEALGLSARGYHKIIMVARTIADIAGSENILISHIAEALQLRSLDRKFRL